LQGIGSDAYERCRMLQGRRLRRGRRAPTVKVAAAIEDGSTPAMNLTCAVGAHSRLTNRAPRQTSRQLREDRAVSVPGVDGEAKDWQWEEEKQLVGSLRATRSACETSLQCTRLARGHGDVWIEPHLMLPLLSSALPPVSADVLARPHFGGEPGRDITRRVKRSRALRTEQSPRAKRARKRMTSLGQLRVIMIDAQRCRGRLDSVVADDMRSSRSRLRSQVTRTKGV
jgi:hypothetical protein